jgi:hypothetical protein
MVQAKQASQAMGSSNTRKDIVDVLRSKDSDYCLGARRSLMYSAMFGFAASVFAFMTLKGYRSLKKKAVKHAEWKHEDQKLDDAIESTLDASDAVAKY